MGENKWHCELIHSEKNGIYFSPDGSALTVVENGAITSVIMERGGINEYKPSPQITIVEPEND